MPIVILACLIWAALLIHTFADSDPEAEAKRRAIRLCVKAHGIPIVRHHDNVLTECVLPKRRIK